MTIVPLAVDAVDLPAIRLETCEDDGFVTTNIFVYRDLVKTYRLQGDVTGLRLAMGDESWDMALVYEVGIETTAIEFDVDSEYPIKTLRSCLPCIELVW